MWTSERVKQLRLKLGWSMVDLSRRLSCSIDELREMEAGKERPLKEHLLQLDALLFQLETYNEQMRRSSQADQAMNDAGFVQIHKKDLKNISKSE